MKKVYPIRNVYLNEKGKGKIKLLTKSNQYEVVSSTQYKYLVVCDNKRGAWFSRKLFQDVMGMRDNKLKELGI